MAVLIGVHPVVEALRAGRPLERILVAKGAGGHRLQEVIDLARDAGTPVRFEDRGAPRTLFVFAKLKCPISAKWKCRPSLF